MMHFFRFFCAAAILAAGCFANPALAQTTYNWTGPANNDLWNDATHWDAGGDIPGSLLNPGGAMNDDVVIMNQLATGTQNSRLQVDAGTIGSLTIGGNATTSTFNTSLQVRTDTGALVVTGDLSLGGMSGMTDTAGQFQMNNGNSQVTIQGDIINVSSHSGNRVLLDGGNGANLNLTGNFGSVTNDGVDLFINRPNALTTAAGSTLYVDDLRVATAFSGDRLDRNWTLDGGRTVEANLLSVGFLDGNDATDRTVTGSLTITDATANVSGGIQIGQTNSATATGERDVVGTINVGAGGTLTAVGTLNLGNMNSDTVNAGSTSEGFLNVTDATSVVTVGNVNVGSNLRGDGTITVDAGVFTSNGRVLLGGDANDASDAGTRGTINVNAGGTFTVASGNTEVGRGGEGILTVDGGTFNQDNNNLVLGQTVGAASGDPQVATGTVVFSNGADVNVGTGANDINFQAGGGTITQNDAATNVTVGRNLNVNGSGGPNSATYTLNDGILTVGDGTGEGDVNLGNFAGAESFFNINGGTLNVRDSFVLLNNPDSVSATVNITGGDVNVGTGGTNQNFNFSSGNAEGTVNISGGTFDVTNNVDFRGSTADGGTDIWNVSGDSAITIGNNLDMDGGSAANVNQLNLINDGNASFIVGGDVLLDNNAQLTFDFSMSNGGSLAIDAGDGDVTMTDADIVFNFNDIMSASAFDRIDLINTTGTLTGEFSTFAFDDVVETFSDGSFYQLKSDGAGVFLQATAVPEPSTLAVLGIVGLVVGFRRRRTKNLIRRSCIDSLPVRDATTSV